MKNPGKVTKNIILFVFSMAVYCLVYSIISRQTTEFLKWWTVLSILIILMFIAKKIRACINYFTSGDSSGNSETENMILHDKIKPKKMFYNQKESQAINTLNSLLSEENYRKVLDRLDSKGMRKGFACLFTGGPGTGKTETVYQIARETKRHIMAVDISQTKDCLYGASEKKIKGIFDTYNNLVGKSEVTPILLFNEADAVISQRKELSDHNRAIDQSENTIQNIILQEMENLTGILIATTNLSQNMDIAFERRFLYRIAFDKPSAENREEIWRTLMPDLPEELCQELSKKYELSGGQIENIARKVEVNLILSNNILPMATLLQYCKDEIHSSIDNSRKIGFTA